MTSFFRFITILLFSFLVSPLYGASFDCNKATTETEKAICADPELSALDDLLNIAWNKSKKLVSIDSQKKWLQKRNLCENNNDCLRKEIGLRIGTLLAVSVGLSERIKETPFRYIKPTKAFVRCRKNYQGTDKLKFVEILFSFEESGPTFKETNIYLDGNYSETVWDWLIWAATASNKQIVTDEVWDQSILARGYKVSREYVNGLKHGRLWNWVIHEDPDRGASFTSFRFETGKIDECLSYIENYSSKTYPKVDNSNFFTWLSKQLASNSELNTNDLIWDNEFRSFLSTNLPNDQLYYFGQTKKGEKETLNYHMVNVLGGPPRRVKVIEKDQYFISGCRFKSCPEKGFVWIDSKNNHIIFGLLVYFVDEKEFHSDGILVLFSRDFNYLDETPIEFGETLTDWFDQVSVDPKEIKFID